MPKMRWMSSMDREEESSSPSVMDSAARICHHTTRQTGGPQRRGGDVDGALCCVASLQELAEHLATPGKEVHMNYAGE